MENLLYYYQHIPEHINPAAFKIGFFSMDYYSLMYLVAFAVVYFLLRWRIKRGEFLTNPPAGGLNILLDFMFYAIPGVLIGGRLGYVLFYNLPYYIANPLEIISPISIISGGPQVTGIYGMSFHGGLIGVVLATILFVRKYKIHPVKSGEAGAKQFNGVNFWQWAEFAVPAIPAGYFFGRIGNFLNGELYGRATEKFWGMYFLSSAETQNFSSLQLRHPSQLYEAFFEGLVLFAILWILRNGIKYKNKMFHVSCFMLYIVGYGISRFFIEFFRDPDPQIGLILAPSVGGLTLGQILSLAMIAFGAAIFFVRKRQNWYNRANDNE